MGEKKNGASATRLSCVQLHFFRFLSCEFSAAGESERNEQNRGEERGRAGEGRRAKKLTALIWNQKGECSLAVTQILHLHLYKTGSPVSLSGSPFPPSPLLSPFLFPFLSLSPLSAHRGSGRCHFRHVFCTLCTSVCVNCGPPFGGSDEEDLFESSRARLCSRTQHGAADTWSAWRARGRRTWLRLYISPPALPSLSLRPLSYFHTLSLFFVSAIPEPGEKQLLLQPVRRLPTFSARLCPINHGGAPAARCFCRSKLHETQNFFQPFGAVTLRWELFFCPFNESEQSWWFLRKVGDQRWSWGKLVLLNEFTKSCNQILNNFATKIYHILLCLCCVLSSFWH